VTIAIVPAFTSVTIGAAGNGGAASSGGGAPGSAGTGGAVYVYW
jgi:hypothetical protein